MVGATAGKNGSTSKDPDVLEAKRSPDCSCWEEYANKGNAHAATANRVAVALARRHGPINTSDLKFIRDNQHSAGWWAPTPASDAE